MAQSAISTSSSASLTASDTPTTRFDLTRLSVTKRPHHAGLPQRAPIQSASHHLTTHGTSKSAASATPEPSDSTPDSIFSPRPSTDTTSGSRRCKTVSGTSSTMTLYADVSTNETKQSPGPLLSAESVNHVPGCSPAARPTLFRTHLLPGTSSTMTLYADVS